MNDPRGAPRVLIVDDEADQVEMYRYGLEQAGFQVVAALTGAAGLDLARTDAPAVIVLDIRLPDTNGWEVCRALKRDPSTAHIPVIILTAAASPSLAREAEKEGCAASLVKPCYPDELAQKIRQVVGSGQ